MHSLVPLPRYGCEHLALTVIPSSIDASRAVAAEVAALIRQRQHEKRPVVLGLATGSTPVAFYAELVRLHREEHLSFANVVTFNLDEYYPLPPEHPQSYRRFMQVHLFDHVDISPANIHLPSGTVAAAEIDAHCRAYEEAIRAAGGIDFQILGIGRTGHIGFNEPGSSRRSRTRLVTLDPLTRRDASGDFGDEEHTPRYALSMGVATILEARQVVLMAWGQHKAAVVRAAVEGEMTPQVTASFLQEHDHALFVLDQTAAGQLTRYRMPWLVGALEDQGLAWDDRMQRRAILWLSQRRQKALLKLTDDDYNEAGLQDLLRVHGSAYETNRAGFYQMQHTITGWPGGRDPRRTRPGDAPAWPLRASSAEVFPKRVLVLSPHPDDDVISMGGTLCRLVEQGHDVHVAYQVSGSGAVSDEAMWSKLRFAGEAGVLTGESATEAKRWCLEFEQTGAMSPSPALLRWKSLVRRLEAIAAARVFGLPAERLRFLELPFYESDSPRRRRIGDADVAIMHRLLTELRPHLIYAAGDLDDPHGTHRLCLRVLREALARCTSEPWLGASELWLYRGAWAGWELDEIDLAVPLSPQEVLRRRRAIFRHETQKDQALFLGDDRREFWQRTEDRSRQLADAYNALGLAEYEAIEAFKRMSPEEFLSHVEV
ncbi:glucosamine-6-phosphate deaminase [Opitutus terrae]|uniref:Glucosamine-6-phosphate deaminase n=1 Tax=Opitutus terrae (strain DSM 11246 / JCM 15787 / PB90-1) TaxID=452637 RepID=B1ZXS2_OPITP|nr:glucosamine-6-phosphate deaminase [Opitutus terrae]ACB74294.1 glucosamine-6-phosphate isomerase [Opitutus terrae PB90-1]